MFLLNGKIYIINGRAIHSACIWAAFKEHVIYTLKSHSECYGKRVSTDNIDTSKAVSTSLLIFT